MKRCSCVDGHADNIKNLLHTCAHIFDRDKLTMQAAGLVCYLHHSVQNPLCIEICYEQCNWYWHDLSYLICEIGIHREILIIKESKNYEKLNKSGNLYANRFFIFIFL